MFTDIAQESQHIHAAEPVIVIGRDGGVFAAIKVQEWGNLFTNFRHPLLNGLFSVQFTLGGFEARVANQTGRAAYQRNRFVPCLLEAFQA